jgi:hypothetical protein
MKYKGSKLLWVVYGIVEAKHDIFCDFFELFITTNVESKISLNCLLHGEGEKTCIYSWIFYECFYQWQKWKVKCKGSTLLWDVELLAKQHRQNLIVLVIVLWIVYDMVDIET